MRRGQLRMKGRAALISGVVVCALLAVGSWHAGGAATHLAQATPYVLGHGGGLAEGGGPPGHR